MKMIFVNYNSTYASLTGDTFFFLPFHNKFKMPVVLRAFFIRNKDAREILNEKQKQNHLPGSCTYDYFDTRNIHSD
jgi:hypothetical protein